MFPVASLHMQSQTRPTSPVNIIIKLCGLVIVDFLSFSRADWLFVAWVSCALLALFSFCYVSVSRTVFPVFCLTVCYYVGVSRNVFSVFCLIVCYVSVSRTVFSVFCLIVCYVGVSRTVFSVFCLIVCYVSVSRTVSSVFCLIVCYVGVSRTVSSVFCLIICYVSVSRAVFLCSVWLFVTLVSRAIIIQKRFSEMFWISNVSTNPQVVLYWCPC